MRSEQYPTSVHGWLLHMGREGVSNRPFALDGSDLIDPLKYHDVLDTKPERAALARDVYEVAYRVAQPLYPPNPRIPNN